MSNREGQNSSTIDPDIKRMPKYPDFGKGSVAKMKEERERTLVEIYAKNSEI